MNLTAKEFIAAQAAAGLSGVLVLSHRTGAADQLGTAALLTDPRSPASLVDTLQQALTLSPAERRTRLKHLVDLLGHQHPTDWASQIITAIQSHNKDGPPTSDGTRRPPRWHSTPSRLLAGTGSRILNVREGHTGVPESIVCDPSGTDLR